MIKEQNMVIFEGFLEPKPKRGLFHVLKMFFWKIGGYCPNHGWFLYPKRFRMNSSYHHEEENWMVGCKHCQQDSEDYFEELWRDYYSSR